jgi:hypothetical protein
MKATESFCYDPKTLQFLRKVLDDSWAALPPERRAVTPKSELALRILRRAAAGERDPVRLRAAAVVGIATPL